MSDGRVIALWSNSARSFSTRRSTQRAFWAFFPFSALRLHPLHEYPPTPKAKKQTSCAVPFPTMYRARQRMEY